MSAHKLYSYRGSQRNAYRGHEDNCSDQLVLRAPPQHRWSAYPLTEAFSSSHILSCILRKREKLQDPACVLPAGANL